MDQVFAVIKTIWDNAKSTIDSVLSQIGKGVTGGWKGIVNTIRSALNDIKTVVTTTWKAVGTVISTVLDGISGAMMNGAPAGTVINNYNNDNSRTVNQTNNSPKSLSRLEIYRMTRNALNV